MGIVTPSIGTLRILPELSILGLQGAWSSWSSWFSSRWQSIGPSIWLESSPGSYQSGAMSQVSIDPANSNCIYASGFDGGLWRLDDVSEYPRRLWTPLTDHDLRTLRISSFVIAPSDSRILYLGDGEGHILRSDDRGESWNNTSSTQFKYVSKILVHPSDAQKIYVASDMSRMWPHGGLSGFYKSDKGGSTWNELHSGEITDAVMDPHSPSILYVGIRRQGLYKVTNAGDVGERWDLVYSVSNVTFPPASSIQQSTIKIAIGHQGNDSNRMVAVKFHRQLFVNHRGGFGRWETKGERGQRADRDQSEYCNVIAINPFNNNIMLTGLQDLYRTTDGGASGGTSWQKVGGYDTRVHADQINITFDPDPKRRRVVYLANDGGIYRSTNNGQTWSELNRGLITSQIPEGIAISNATIVASVYHGGVIANENIFSSNQVWRSIPGGEDQYNNRTAWEWTKTYADPKRTNVFYLFGTQLVRRILGYGVTTNLVSIGNFRPQAIAVDSRYDSDIIISSSINPDPSNPLILNPKIKLTLEGNSNTPNWRDETVENILSNENIISITFAPSDRRMAYAASNLGNIYLKTDVGSPSIWKHVAQWPNQQSVRQIVVNPQDPMRIYLLSNTGIVRYEDAVQRFTPIHGSAHNSLPPNTELISLVAYPFNPQVLFLASSAGIFITPNEGTAWFRFDSGLPNARITQIIWHLSSLYAATMGRGLWRKHITRQSTAVKSDNKLYYLVKHGKEQPNPAIDQQS